MHCYVRIDLLHMNIISEKVPAVRDSQNTRILSILIAAMLRVANSLDSVC